VGEAVELASVVTLDALHVVHRPPAIQKTIANRSTAMPLRFSQGLPLRTHLASVVQTREQPQRTRASIALLPLASGSMESDARFGLLALPIYWGLAVAARRRWLERGLLVLRRSCSWARRRRSRSSSRRQRQAQRRSAPAPPARAASRTATRRSGRARSTDRTAGPRRHPRFACAPRLWAALRTTGCRSLLVLRAGWR
jgi:hypothetical protein